MRQWVCASRASSCAGVGAQPRPRPARAGTHRRSSPRRPAPPSLPASHEGPLSWAPSLRACVRCCGYHRLLRALALAMRVTPGQPIFTYAWLVAAAVRLAHAWTPAQVQPLVLNWQHRLFRSHVCAIPGLCTCCVHWGGCGYGSCCDCAVFAVDVDSMNPTKCALILPQTKRV